MSSSTPADDAYNAFLHDCRQNHGGVPTADSDFARFSEMMRLGTLAVQEWYTQHAINTVSRPHQVVIIDHGESDNDDEIEFPDVE